MRLDRDREHDSVSVGMGGVRIPCVVPREAIRREGERLGYTGEGLEDFTEIVVCVDDLYVEVAVKRQAEEQRLAALRARNGGR